MNCRIVKSLLIVWCLCSAVVFSAAQCPDAAELNITATLYTQENGLTSNMLINIASDSIGYRYFMGLDAKWVRFDGVNFSFSDRAASINFDNYGFIGGPGAHYTQQYLNKVVYKVEKDNNITRSWALTGDSLICDQSCGKKEIFVLPQELFDFPGLKFYPEGDNCWLIAQQKIFRFNIGSKKFQSIPLPANLVVTSPVQEPAFIYSPTNSSPYLLSGNTLLKLNDQQGSFEKHCTFSARPFFAGLSEIIMDNYLFVVESGTIIHEINLATGIAKKIDFANYAPGKNASALTIIDLKRYKNYLLIGTSNAGLFIFNRCTGSMQNFQYEKQYSGTASTNSVAWLAVNDEHVIWMQTDAGLIKLELNNQRMKTYTPSSLKSGGMCNNCNNVRAIYSRDSNELLVGSFAGLYTFNLATGRFDQMLSASGKQPVWNDHGIGAITGDGHGNVFIADWSNLGILLLNKGKKKIINILAPGSHPGYAYSNLRCLYYDSHHVLWGGTTDGFIRITNLDEFQKNNFTGKIISTNQFPGEHNQLSNKIGTCFAFTEDQKGNIWLGTSEGLSIYNYKTNTITKYVHTSGDKNSLSDNDVRSIHISKDNTVWIGTNSGGLNRFDVHTKTFTAFDTENGLPNNSIYTILGDDKGYLWLGTNAGLCRFNKADHSVRNYTPRDGIQNFEFNTNAVAVTADGRFCFGGRTGFNIFHPDSMNATVFPPQVVIAKFKIFDKEFPVTDEVLHLAHDENSFTFDFAALNYYRSNDNQYAYMMEGADKDWIKSGNRQYTSYNNLPPGSYTFKVLAANYTGMWSKGITSMQFIINPAWYKTWWFRTAIAILLAAGVYGFYRYRLSQIMKLQEVRNRIASDLHDEIGSTLSSISLSSTIIQGKLYGTNTEVDKLLKQVSSNTDNMMEALSDIVWAINTRNDRFDNVVNRMRAFAIEVLEPSNINIHFKVSEDTMDFHFDMQQRKNIYLVFKEAVNNIVKYSGCQNVWIDIHRKGNKTFILVIKDDGKGFEIPVPNGEAKSLSGNGIRNMKKRAEELGGEMTIYSVRGQGATLNLKFTI